MSSPLEPFRPEGNANDSNAQLGLHCTRSLDQLIETRRNMAKSIRKFTNCWVRHVPNLEVGTIHIEPSEIIDVSLEIGRAKEKDVEAARSLIERFCTSVDNNSEIDDRLVKFIAKALQVLVEGDKPNLSRFAKTLGIMHNSHRPKKYEERNKDIYFAVRTNMRNMSYDDACVQVGAMYFRSPEQIKKIYHQRNKDHLQFLLEMEEWGGEVTAEDWEKIRRLQEKKP